MFSGKRFAVTPGKDNDNYVFASFGEAVEMTTELADLVLAGVKTATVSLACDHGEGHEATPRRGDFVITSDGEEPSTVHGTAGLAAHIRALLPIKSGLTRKGREAGVRWRTPGRHSLSDNQ
jgi:hypothetical protein